MTSPPSSPVYNGRYELRSQIARGGTAQVYRAHDLLLDRPVALKVLIPELSADHSFVERFRREAQAAANLSHPNIVPVFDWGESEHTYFIVMEYVDGEPLSSIIHSQAPLEPAQTASIGSDIAKALSYAHRHGVVHRDVKPGNVLITADGQVKVTDFGIARAIGGGEEKVTQTGLVMGTATYFSPEQAQGFEVDGRSDVYSLGVVLYEMATGRPPFTGDNPVSIAYQHVREEPPPPRSVNPDIPPALEAIVRQAMAKLPAQRYATAEELRADLDRFVRGQTVLAVPPTLARDPLTEAIGQSAPRPGGAVAPGTSSGTGQRTATPAWVISGALLLSGIVLIIFFGGRQLGYFGGARYVRVPDVSGRSLSKAHATLDSEGLSTNVHDVSGAAGTAPGTVVSQYPDPPATLRSGGTVTLDVAGHLPKTSVPNVVNAPYTVAYATLRGAGFKVKTKRVKQSKTDQTQGEVVRQDPGANSNKAPGSTITLYVVTGTKNVTVPTFSLNGAPENAEQAGAAITKLGLVPATPVDAYSATVPAGDVISSSPASGASVLPGTPIVLTISEGGVTVPDLRGDSVQQAEAALSALGLVGEVGAPIQTPVAGYVDNVARTKPVAETVVAPGSTVELRVGVAPPGSTTTTTTTTLPLTTTTTTLPPPP